MCILAILAIFCLLIALLSPFYVISWTRMIINEKINMIINPIIPQKPEFIAKYFGDSTPPFDFMTSNDIKGEIVFEGNFSFFNTLPETNENDIK